jgi:hypothetical protein
MIVDFPAPVAPTMATRWPGSTVKSMPRSTHSRSLSGATTSEGVSPSSVSVS